MSKIVVVDDSYAELQLIEGCLKAANHTVVSYPNSEKLEDKVAIEKPDLIVMDVVMPGRNGFQACRWQPCLRASQNWGRTPRYG